MPSICPVYESKDIALENLADGWHTGTAAELHDQLFRGVAGAISLPAEKTSQSWSSTMPAKRSPVPSRRRSVSYVARVMGS